MGWAHCGEDSDGRPIGYAVEATCDHPGCDERIDRGLSYCCGGMHGGEAIENHDGTAFVTTCARYFCPEHRAWVAGFIDGRDRGLEVCASCREEVLRHVGDYDKWPDSWEPPTEPEG